MTIPITLTVEPEEFSVIASPLNITATHRVGVDSCPQDLASIATTISSGADFTLSNIVLSSELASVIDASVSPGGSAATQTLNVSFNCADATAGVRNGSVSATATDPETGVSAPVTIPITLTVEPEIFTVITSISSINAIHEVGQSSCPQVLADIEIYVSSNEEFELSDVTVSNEFNSIIDFIISPGGLSDTQFMRVQFNCNDATSIVRTGEIQATITGTVAGQVEDLVIPIELQVTDLNASPDRKVMKKSEENKGKFSKSSNNQSQELNSRSKSLEEVSIIKSTDEPTFVEHNMQDTKTRENSVNDIEALDSNVNSVSPSIEEQRTNTVQGQVRSESRRRLNNTNRSIAREPDFDLPHDIDQIREQNLGMLSEPLNSPQTSSPAENTLGLSETNQPQEDQVDNSWLGNPLQSQNSTSGSFVVHQNQELVELNNKQEEKALKPTTLTTERLQARKLRANKLSAQTLQSNRLSAKRLSERKQQPSNIDNKSNERSKRLQQTQSQNEEILKNNIVEKKRIERAKRLEKIKQKTDSKRSENKK